MNYYVGIVYNIQEWHPVSSKAAIQRVPVKTTGAKLTLNLDDVACVIQELVCA